MLNRLYSVIDPMTKQSLTPTPTFNRDVARAEKLLLKQAGVEAVIMSQKIMSTDSKIIR